MKLVFVSTFLVVCLTHFSFAQQQAAKKLFQEANQLVASSEFEAALPLFHESMEIWKKEGNDTSVILCLREIGIAYWELQKYDQAVDAFFSQLEKIKSGNHEQYLAACYNNLGLVYHTQRNYPKALKYYGLAIHTYKQKGEKEKLGVSLLNYGIILKNQGIYDLAMSQLVQAEQLLRSKGLPLDLASTYEALGLLNHRLKQYESAIALHKKALEIRVQQSYDKGIAKSYNNVGLSFEELEKLDSAIFYYQRSLEIKEQLGGGKRNITTLENLGNVHLKYHRLGVAEKYFERAYELAEEWGVEKEKAAILNDLGKLYFERGALGKAKDKLKQAETIARDLSLTKILIENLSLQSLLYEESNEYQTALAYQKKYKELEDVLLSEEKTKFIAQLQVIHEVDQIQSANRLLNQQSVFQEKELQAEIAYRNQLTLAAIVLCIFLVLLFLSNRRVKKVNDRLTQTNQELSETKHQIDLLYREMKHRVNNNMQLISSILSLQKESLEDKKAALLLASVEERINAIRIIHSRLEQKGDNTVVNLKAFILQLVKELKVAYMDPEFAISEDLQLEDIDLDTDRANAMGLIINEVLTNAFKYVYHKQLGSKLKIVLRKDTNNQLYLAITDDGKQQIGANELSRKGSFGMDMIETLSKQLKAKTAFTYANGLKFKLIV